MRLSASNTYAQIYLNITLLLSTRMLPDTIGIL